ncbi:MAG: hypothetical protein WDM78_17790 [Puia sp.]
MLRAGHIKLLNMKWFPLLLLFFIFACRSKGPVCLISVTDILKNATGKLITLKDSSHKITGEESNMLKVIKAIVQFQSEYFKYGDTMQLQPMVLKNIAEIVGLDISTVSRITCNKYADTPFWNDPAQRFVHRRFNE